MLFTQSFYLCYFKAAEAGIQRLKTISARNQRITTGMYIISMKNQQSVQLHHLTIK